MQRRAHLSALLLLLYIWSAIQISYGRTISVQGNCNIGMINYDELNVIQTGGPDSFLIIEKIETKKSVHLSGRIRLTEKLEINSDEKASLEINGTGSIISLEVVGYKYDLNYNGSSSVVYIPNPLSSSVTVSSITNPSSTLNIYQELSADAQNKVEDLSNSSLINNSHCIVLKRDSSSEKATIDIDPDQPGTSISYNIYAEDVTTKYNENTKLLVSLNSNNDGVSGNTSCSYTFEGPVSYAQSQGIEIVSSTIVSDNNLNLEFVNSKIEAVKTEVICDTLRASCSSESFDCQKNVLQDLVSGNASIFTKLKLNNLDLSESNIESRIPEKFFSTVLKSGVNNIDMNNNNIKGLVSIDICNVVGTAGLDLGMNDIYGGMPKCLENESAIKNINLSCTYVNTENYKPKVVSDSLCNGYKINKENQDTCSSMCGLEFVEGEKVFSFLQNGPVSSLEEYSVVGVFDSSKNGKEYTLDSGESLIIEGVYYTKNCKVVYKLVSPSLLGDDALYIEENNINDLCSTEVSDPGAIKVDNINTDIELSSDGEIKKFKADISTSAVLVNEDSIDITVQFKSDEISLSGTLAELRGQKLNFDKFAKVKEISLKSGETLACSDENGVITCSGTLAFELQLYDENGNLYTYLGTCDCRTKKIILEIGAPIVVKKGIVKIAEIRANVIYTQEPSSILAEAASASNRSSNVLTRQTLLSAWPSIENGRELILSEIKPSEIISYIYTNVLKTNNKAYYAFVVTETGKGMMSLFSDNSSGFLVGKPVYTWAVPKEGITAIEEKIVGDKQTAVKTLRFLSDTDVTAGFAIDIISRLITSSTTNVYLVTVTFSKNGDISVATAGTTLQNTSSDPSDIEIETNSDGSVIIKQGINTSVIDTKKIVLTPTEIVINTTDPSSSDSLCSWFQEPIYDELSKFISCKMSAKGIGVFAAIAVIALAAIIIAITLPTLKKIKQNKMKVKGKAENIANLPPTLNKPPIAVDNKKQNKESECKNLPPEKITPVITPLSHLPANTSASDNIPPSHKQTLTPFKLAAPLGKASATHALKTVRGNNIPPVNIGSKSSKLPPIVPSNSDPVNTSPHSNGGVINKPLAFNFVSQNLTVGGFDKSSYLTQKMNAQLVPSVNLKDEIAEIKVSKKEKKTKKEKKEALPILKSTAQLAPLTTKSLKKPMSPSDDTRNSSSLSSNSSLTENQTLSLRSDEQNSMRGNNNGSNIFSMSFKNFSGFGTKFIGF